MTFWYGVVGFEVLRFLTGSVSLDFRCDAIDLQTGNAIPTWQEP